MQLLIRKYLPGEPLPPLFDCGKTDLNEFLLETGTATPNATLYEKEHLSRTYIVEDSDTDRVLGYSILNFIKGVFFNESRAGCRFLTVDAYLDAENFYAKCNFARLIAPEPDDETVLMYFDLKSIERI